MTVICGGGTSAAKPGFNQTVQITGAAVEGALALLGLEPLAALLAPFISGEVYDLSNFCTVDPPADPGLTAQDLIDVTNFVDPTVSIPAMQKAQTWFKSWYWYQVCQCTSNTTPAAPTPSNPGNVVSTNPSLPSGTVGATCWDFTGTGTALRGHANYNQPQFLPATPSITYTHDFGFPAGVPATFIPTGANNLVTSLTTIVTDPAVSQSIILQFVTAAGANAGTTSIYSGNAAVTNFKQTLTIPATASYWYLYTDTPSTTIDFEWSMELSFSCAGQTPGTVNTPCCPPDPTLETRLNAIFGLVQSIYQSLPTPIGSLADGSSHAGLTGDGTVVLTDAAIAIRVELTTIPASLGRDLSTPEFLFDAGSMMPIIDGSPMREKRIVYATQQFWLNELTDSVGYKLHPGVVATIVELTRGP